ncbi:blast:Mitochondrial import inner membrane translocase subunit tim13 [Drosophila guanche]|uniref:Blast:Mitochondrial import inner membrane translocase subunit tim13 n=1 Tax=Drosophila guanche TaxID=7266 RepID=A0A3B0J895_DROGU|nr:blast:Mitochondrial import inner membrane translocase subunit tim13 [Drosophila guanche]
MPQQKKEAARAEPQPESQLKTQPSPQSQPQADPCGQLAFKLKEELKREIKEELKSELMKDVLIEWTKIRQSEMGPHKDTDRHQIQPHKQRREKKVKQPDIDVDIGIGIAIAKDKPTDVDKPIVQTALKVGSKDNAKETRERCKLPLQSARSSDNIGTMIDKVSSKCFCNCVGNYSSALEAQDQSCIEDCMKDYLEGYYLVNGTLDDSSPTEHSQSQERPEHHHDVSLAKDKDTNVDKPLVQIARKPSSKDIATISDNICTMIDKVSSNCFCNCVGNHSLALKAQDQSCIEDCMKDCLEKCRLVNGTLDDSIPPEHSLSQEQPEHHHHQQVVHTAPKVASKDIAKDTMEQGKLQLQSARSSDNIGTTIYKVSTNCFRKCIINYALPLEAQDRSCIEDCMKTYLESYRLVNRTFVDRIHKEHRQRKEQRKEQRLEEHQEKQKKKSSKKSRPQSMPED